MAATSLFQFTMLSSSLTFFFIFTFLILIITIHKINNNNNSEKQEKPMEKIQSLETGRAHDPENTGHSLVLGILPSNSAKWDTISEIKDFEESPDEINGSGQEEKIGKKKRTKKKRVDPNEDDLLCSVPFTKSSSATQRKIKEQYDRLVKAHGTKGLALDQVGQFVNCLIEAKNELQHKSEVIKRRFTITSALLFKADRSSYVRIRQQLCKIELEQKRLEEDINVYNWLQERVKVSPAYKKMLEIGACVEMEENNSSRIAESTEAEFSGTSFEEFLAREKKDAFWQRNGKLKHLSE